MTASMEEDHARLLRRLRRQVDMFDGPTHWIDTMDLLASIHYMTEQPQFVADSDRLEWCEEQVWKRGRGAMVRLLINDIEVGRGGSVRGAIDNAIRNEAGSMKKG
jgi:hypothetical protein